MVWLGKTFYFHTSILFHKMCWLIIHELMWLPTTLIEFWFLYFSLILMFFQFFIFFNCFHIVPSPFYLNNVFKVLWLTHVFDNLFCHMKHVLVLKLLKEMVGFHSYYLFNFLSPFHVKVISMDNAEFMKTNASHNHIWYIS